MTSLPEQLSAARKSQLDAQFRLLHSFTDRAFDNASRLMALNLAVSRESVERSSRTVSALLGATSPRDLGLLRSHAEEQMRSMVAYGREVFGIATGIRPHAVPLTTPTPVSAPAALPSPTQIAQTVIEASAPVAKTVENAVQAGAEIVETVSASASNSVKAAGEAMHEVTEDVAKESAHAVDQVEETLSALVQEQALKDEPAVVQSLEPADLQAAPLDQPTPVAKPKPIAKAAGKGAPKAAVAQHPLAAPVETKDSATVTRIDSAPPKRRK